MRNEILDEARKIAVYAYPGEDPAKVMAHYDRDIEHFYILLVMADRKIHTEEMRMYERVFGHTTTPEQWQDLYRQADWLPDEGIRVPALIRDAIAVDLEQGTSYGPRILKTLEQFGLHAIAADDDVSEHETRALTQYLDRARAVMGGPPPASPQAPPPAPPPPLVAPPPQTAAPTVGPWATSAQAPPSGKRSFGRKGLPPGAPAPAAAPAAAQASVATPVDRLTLCLDELNALIGLEGVKSEVGALVNFIRVRQLREQNGLPVPNLALHMVFTGNPGTGKTTVARLLGSIFKSLGLLPNGNLIEVDRSGLVGQYIGHTEKKTQEAIQKAVGGILFIDEAYALAKQGSSNDFGQEAIAVLLKAMEDRRHELVVVAAGYSGPMQVFLESNPGMRSRVNRIIHFADYTSEELITILKKMAKDSGYQLTAEAETLARSLFDELLKVKDQTFGNARTARNIFETALTRHANRVAQMKAPTNDDLSTLSETDLPKLASSPA